tara:strand:- start:1178 stop:1489 length:312 start_codon:yes stop_codon:yes gene_type:complete
MLIIFLLLVVFIFTFKKLASHIKKIRTGDPNESDITYWMFSYDFKSPNKNWTPEDKGLLDKKRARNFLVFILYLNAFGIFLLLNSFTSHILNFIVNPKFSYPI